MPTTSLRCQSCEVLTINGRRCHETGCPDAWRDRPVSCEWCGCAIIDPESPRTRFCDESCAESYNT
jgi:hypothetical protein